MQTQRYSKSCMVTYAAFLSQNIIYVEDKTATITGDRIVQRQAGDKEGGRSAERLASGTFSRCDSN